jgi:hypothetical protein
VKISPPFLALWALVRRRVHSQEPACAGKLRKLQGVLNQSGFFKKFVDKLPKCGNLIMGGCYIFPYIFFFIPNLQRRIDMMRQEGIMRGSRLTIGFAVASFMLTAILVTALQPKSGEYRLVQPEEAAMVRGGGLSPNSGDSSASSAINIPLNNVPYITQHLNPNERNNTSQQISRSSKYCGIAVLRVRLWFEQKMQKMLHSLPVICLIVGRSTIIRTLIPL